jgi:UDP-N-acetyl-D-glucosamine dehydrogenase
LPGWSTLGHLYACMAEELERRIRDRTAHICVIGLGYVGLPLAVEFAEAGYHVVGVDVDVAKVDAIRDGRSYIPDVAGKRVDALVRVTRLSATTDYESIDPSPDAVFICVPTPYTTLKVPDLSFITQAAETIAAGLRPGQLVVLESTTYPGTTEELVLPILQGAGDMRHERDFFLAFSPERIDPGQAHYDIGTVTKVVGGAGPGGRRMASLLFEAVAPGKVHGVSSARTAEMAKLLENTFRSVNIALVNELAMLAERMNLDIWEVIDAASTKPFGFMPFYPGPGVGGHCIPVDPFYLSWKAREFDFYTRFVELAAEINDNMPFHTVELVERALDSRGLATRGARILVLGVAFKRNVDDARNSPARRVVELLRTRGAQVSYHDPHVPCFRVAGTVFGKGDSTDLRSVDLDDHILEWADAVVILVAHSAIDFPRVALAARLLIDATGITRSLKRPDAWRLGAPAPALT